MRTPSGKLIVEFAEDEIAFLNMLNTILPVAVPDFRRAVRRAVVEASHIIPFDAFGVVRAGRTDTEITIYAVGALSSPLLAAVRADLERAGVPAGGGPGPRSDVEVEVVELSGPSRAPEAVEAASAYVAAADSAATCSCAIFAAAAGVFERKHQVLLSVLATWLRSYLAFSDAYRQMEEMSVTDPLTGCYNRRKFVDEAERELERARRYGYDLCVALVDVDRLKQINDSFGHGTGDVVLKATTDGLARRLRKVDVFARYGGDEFAVLLPHTPLPGGVLALQRVLAACREQVSQVEARVSFSASAGVAAWRRDESLESLLRRADTALYAAKREHPGTVVAAD
ncbi:MAG: GGDEF domain-containing protein [Deltaproteobacteria bacterium]|nr:GGDEF domain-containing protein [Deltaproteobacteria bacterium]